MTSEQLYANKFENINEIDKFLEKLLKVIYEEIDNLIIPYIP